MNKFIFRLCLSVCATLLVFSCDDEAGNLTPPTPEALLTQTWRIQDITVYENGEEVSSADYSRTSITFNEDGTYSVDVVSNAFPESSGTWAWANPDVKRNLMLDAGTENEVLIVVDELQADLLDIEFEREGGVVNGRTARTIPDRTFEITFRSI